ncbi:hypothetical protein AAT19DRAFT_9061 [Rhodotorula toruloides]|uniref:Uncharacterized protein n=1 Tax=Rhodotorula toruloides TaxID=5286 RepID=A0A2T0AJ08_RHOTO|nr:hypothetical protein AAT19DRAFT_9061 [Rhodotorula toruloides]
MVREARPRGEGLLAGWTSWITISSLLRHSCNQFCSAEYWNEIVMAYALGSTFATRFPDPLSSLGKLADHERRGTMHRKNEAREARQGEAEVAQKQSRESEARGGIHGRQCVGHKGERERMEGDARGSVCV